MPKWRTIAGPMVGVVAVALLFVVVPLIVSGAGTPQIWRVMLLRGANGDDTLVALLDRRTLTYLGDDTKPVEVIAWDLKTDTRRGTLALGRLKRDYVEDHLFRHAGDRAWWKTRRGRLELLDLRKPAVLIAADDLVARVPALAAGYEVHEDVADPGRPQPAIGVTLHDGHHGWIDQRPAFVDEPPPAAPTPAPPGFFCDSGSEPSCARRECMGFASSGPSQEGMVLARAQPWPYRGPRTPVAPDAAVLLDPGLVTGIETRCAFEVDGSTLVLHDSAATDPKEKLLSLLDPEGHVRWTVKLSQLTRHPNARPLGATVLGDGIDLFLSEEDHDTLEYARLSMDGKVLAHHPLL